MIPVLHYSSLLTAHYSLLTIRYSPLTAHYSLLITRYALLIVCLPQVRVSVSTQDLKMLAIAKDAKTLKMLDRQRLGSKGKGD